MSPSKKERSLGKYGRLVCLSLNKPLKGCRSLFDPPSFRNWKLAFELIAAPGGRFGAQRDLVHCRHGCLGLETGNRNGCAASTQVPTAWFCSAMSKLPRRKAVASGCVCVCCAFAYKAQCRSTRVKHMKPYCGGYGAFHNPLSNLFATRRLKPMA